MVRKKLAILFIIILYLSFFIFSVPVHLLGHKLQSGLVSKITYSLYYYPYQSWIGSLNENNLIRVLWINNGEFWCAAVDPCTVQSAASKEGVRRS